MCSGAAALCAVLHLREMPTAFESKVHAVVRGVPAGKVTTYGAVAKVAGGCARSVGAVMRKNCPAETQVP